MILNCLFPGVMKDDQQFYSLPASSPLSLLAMPPTPSLLTVRLLRHLLYRPALFFPAKRSPTNFPPSVSKRIVFIPKIKQFCTTPSSQATYNQVRRGCRVEQRARKRRSPALVDRPQMKGVCLKTGITKPKKPNSGERKTARIRLSSGRVVTAYIPGEG